MSSPPRLASTHIASGPPCWGAARGLRRAPGGRIHRAPWGGAGRRHRGDSGGSAVAGGAAGGLGAGVRPVDVDIHGDGGGGRGAAGAQGDPAARRARFVLLFGVFLLFLFRGAGHSL